MARMKEFCQWGNPTEFFGVMKMQRYIITTGTVTYAIKGKDLLKRNGIKAKVERIMSGKGSSSCGYSIIIENNLDAALSLLKSNGIKILEVNEKL